MQAKVRGVGRAEIDYGRIFYENSITRGKKEVYY
jgi:hypothetical protein